jgi:tRNA threonylcarbamoyladenosine biosynthesis protein TsaE
MIKTVRSIRQTEKLAKLLVKKIKSRCGAAVLFNAEMGAGKTTFISFIVRYLNKKIKVSSPTFTIINKYTNKIYHADLYRVKPEDIENTGIYDIIADKNNFVFVEWAAGLQIRDAITVKINILEGGAREFIIG